METVTSATDAELPAIPPPLDGTSCSEASATVRRRRWDEAFASSGSESVTPEPGALPLENVEEVEMCSSSTGANGVNKLEKEDSSMVCEAHPSCFKTFANVREYEKHYHLRHMHKCITCNKSLPSAHILELHVLEAHDTLFSLMAERKPMLACFLESCTNTFWKSEERKEHCLLEHKFPKSFTLWDLTTTSASTKQGKKSGPKQNSKGKSTNKQKTEKNPASCGSKNNEKMQIDVSSASNEVSSSSDIPTVSTIQNEGMEMEPSVKNTQKKKPLPKAKQVQSDTAKNNGPKVVPSHITFGHSASRAFRPKFAFGLDKSTAAGGTSKATTSKMDLDLSDIRDVLPASTVTSVTSTPATATDTQ